MKIESATYTFKCSGPRGIVVVVMNPNGVQDVCAELEENYYGANNKYWRRDRSESIKIAHKELKKCARSIGKEI